MGLRTWYFGRAVKASRDNAVGPIKAIWGFLDGFKLVIWSFVVALKQAFPDWPFWGYIDAGAAAIGWNKLAPSIDPGQLVMFGTLAFAIGHKLLKAYQEHKVGIPFAEVGRSQLDQSVAVIHPEPGAPPVVVTKAELSLARAQPTAKVVVLEPKPGD